MLLVIFSCTNSKYRKGKWRGEVPRGHHEGDLGSKGVHSWDCLIHRCNSRLPIGALHEGCEEYQLQSLDMVRRQKFFEAKNYRGAAHSHALNITVAM